MSSPIPSPGPPHIERLLVRLGELTGPVIQVRGWPGTGRHALLEALVEASGERGRALAGADVETAEDLARSLASPDLAGARWLVALSLPAACLPAACRLLRPGQRLVCAGTRRLETTDLPVSFLGPGELLLTADEGRELVRQVLGSAAGGDPPADGTAEALREAVGGWYAPLLFATGALAREELDPEAAGDPGALLEVPAIDSFLTHEVLEPLSESVRSELRARALAEETPELAGLALPPLVSEHLRRPPSSSPTAGRATPRPPEVRVSLLGPARMTVVAKDPEVAELEIHWPLARALKILAYLASSEGFRAARSDLAGALWPEDDEARIQRNFHPTLSHLRRTFRQAWEQARGAPAPAPLLFLHGSYQLNPEIEWAVDVVELTAAVERGRELRESSPQAAARGWSVAAALYRGPFLAGVYDAWTDIPRERYLRRWLDLLRELGDLHVELGQPTEAIDAYRRILIEDPLREPVHQALMEVYSKLGRRDLVRRQYDRLATLLAEELGVDPLPQTTEEYHRLMG